ncbi:MAG: Leucine carboxyl methyltransferase 1 [Marteilia pararefringens]
MESARIAAISKLICKRKGYACVDDIEPLELLCSSLIPHHSSAAFSRFAFSSPEINRGTFLRCRAIRQAIDVFIAQNTSSDCLIINFGAGLDTLAWRDGISAARYIEIDKPEVCSLKIRLILNNEALQQKLCISDSKFNTDSMISDRYSIYPCDISQFSTQQLIEKCSIKGGMKVLIIFECILMYLDYKTKTNLISTLSDLNFSSLNVFLFEPINLDDKYGQNMIKSLKLHDDLDLEGLGDCGNIRNLLSLFNKDKFQFNNASYYLMSDAFHKINKKLRQNIEKIEPLDERNLMDELFKHYCFVTLSHCSTKLLDIKIIFDGI